ncbi:lipopolysaccharide biosynthesis protein [Roseovarius sp. S4756]|uniref:lipopolysaccharide biosynthesis protein n=1 Tax=Roseovarius maritimus TaxID=3342637 RepID=UPI0037269B5B
MRPKLRTAAESHATLLDLRVFGGIAVKIATAVLQFLAIPVIIWQAGLETYGLFGIFSILIIYFAMADLGITKSTLRFVSMSLAEDVSEVFSVIFILTAVFCLFFVGIGLLLSDPILWLMGIEATTSNRTIYYLALATSLLFVARSLYVSVMYALERFRFAYNTTVAFDMLRWGASIAAVTLFKETLLALILVVALSTFAHVVMLAYVVHFPNRVRIAIPKNASLMKAILHYSFSVFAIDIFNKVSSYTDKILVASTGVVVNFAHYYIAFQVVGKISDFLSAATIPYIQSVAKLFSRSDKAAIRATINAAFDKVGILFLPLIFSLLVFGKTYLSLWLDPVTAAEVYPFLAVLSAGYAMSIYGTITINLANAVGQTSISVLSTALMAGTILVGGLLTLPTYGPLGMSVVWTASQVIPLVIVFPVTMRVLGIGRIRLVLRAFATIAWIAATFFLAKVLAHALFLTPTSYEMLVPAIAALALSYSPTLLSLVRNHT